MTDQHLSDVDEGHVRSALAAVEIADGIVPAEALAALQTDALRAVVAQRLEAAGRVLLKREHNGVIGYTSGFQDTIAEHLAREGIGVLPPMDRAVLAMVLLRTVAAPRARGEHHSRSWMANGPGTQAEELYANAPFTHDQIRLALRRLKARRLLRTGFHGATLPGPALLRLTDQQSARLWEDLVLVTRPTSRYALAIRQRRQEHDAGQGESAPEE
ncbi:hypothetical protein ACWD4B_01530 [Streptomyces sp. NPDC002536]